VGDEGVKAGRRITRLAVAFESGRDGFWLARHMQEHGIEAHVIHAASVVVPRTPFETPLEAAPCISETVELLAKLLKRVDLSAFRG
jgi:hypothetical protein